MTNPSSSLLKAKMLSNSRKLAREQGIKYYIGKPCALCGGTKRYAASSGCVNKTCNNLNQIKFTAASRRKKKYGLTAEQHKELLDQHQYRCAVCNRHESQFSRKLYIDHCHVSGKVRGMLCTYCNTALGQMQEDVSRMEALIRYTKERCGG